MSRVRTFFLLALCMGMFELCAQSNYAPLNEDYYHWIDRYEVKTGRIAPQLFTTIKPYRRSSIIAFVDSLKEHDVFNSASDQFNYEYLTGDSWEWSPSGAAANESARPLLKHFYKKKSDFYSVHTEDFDLHVNPVLYLGVGKDSERDEMLFVNTRGVEVRGMVDNKVGFYTYLTDNQAMLPSYVARQMSFTGVVPHEGFWKDYKEGEAVDFLHARGYISFEATRSIALQFGHDRQFVGNGYRSLIFSDYAPPSLFLKGNVKVWKLNYLFLLNQMTADNKAIANGPGGYPNKFVAFHHLSLNIGTKLNVGIFESVIFSPDDSLGTDRFRLEYLNPIIFYRAIEQQNGSSDNAMLGIDFKWNALRKLSFYGQFVLDEFVIDNIRAGNGWWANKFGVQFGGKYVDAFGFSNLDLQGEINLLRPYTYSHHSLFGSYSHYRQPIAHPMGANLKELVGIVRYQPLPKLNLTGKLVFTTIGRDLTSEMNWGGDVLKNNRTREQEYDNTIAQGISNDIVFGSFTASWQLKHNLFIDGSLTARNSTSTAGLYIGNTTITSVALRWNIPQRLYEF